jgi:hypothetical protein
MIQYYTPILLAICDNLVLIRASGGVVGKLKTVAMRIIAVFARDGLKVVGAGAIAGVSLWLAVITAGIAGVAKVVEKLAEAYLDDGTLDTDEINDAFNAAPKPAN